MVNADTGRKENTPAGITRRHFIKTGITAAGSIMTAPVRSFARTEAPVLRLGYLPITDATPLLVAHANGYFSDEGLTVAPPVKLRTWSALTESFLTGKINLAHMLLPIPVWMRFHSRFPVKVMAWDHTNGSALTVRNDSGIHSFADLGGKQIAVPYWYSMHNIILQMGIRASGLTPVIQPQNQPLDKGSVNLFILPPPEMPSALAARKIDGYIVAEPFNAVAEKKLGARILRFTGDIWKNHPCCVVVMHENLTHMHPIFTQKVINAVVRAQLFAENNREATARLLSRDGNNYIPLTSDTLNRAINFYDTGYYGENGTHAIHHPDWQMERIGFQPYPFPSATRFIIGEMRQTHVEGDTGFLQDHDIDFMAANLIDDTFVKKAIDLVGGPGRFPLINQASPWTREERFEL